MLHLLRRFRYMTDAFRIFLYGCQLYFFCRLPDCREIPGIFQDGRQLYLFCGLLQQEDAFRSLLDGFQLYFFRRVWDEADIGRPGAYAMLATVMNALAVSDKLEQLGVPTEVFTSITMPQVAQPFTRKDALRAMDEGKIAVFGGGTGNPFFSTDTATALRAVEVSADVMFKATMVDGVYDKDPHKYPDAKKYDTLTFTKVLEDQLAVMDGTAATLCRDNKLPILVFDLADPDNIAKAVQGENVGTLVYEG